MKICNIQFGLEAREAERVSLCEETGKTNEQWRERKKERKEDGKKESVPANSHMKGKTSSCVHYTIVLTAL